MKRVVLSAEHGADVRELLARGALFDVLQVVGVYLDGVDEPALADASRGADREPAGAGPYVGHVRARLHPEDVHHAFDL
jgi:hypothetical protein